MNKSRRQDKQRKAEHPGKRESASGNTYYEHRMNRADKNKTTRLKKGGLLKKIKKALNKNITLKQIFSGK